MARKVTPKPPMKWLAAIVAALFGVGTTSAAGQLEGVSSECTSKIYAIMVLAPRKAMLKENGLLKAILQPSCQQSCCHCFGRFRQPSHGFEHSVSDDSAAAILNLPIAPMSISRMDCSISLNCATMLSKSAFRFADMVAAISGLQWPINFCPCLIQYWERHPRAAGKVLPF